MGKRKIAAGIFCVTLLCLLGFPSQGVFGQPTDIQNHWARPSILKWLDYGFINGYADGSFQPDAPVTRAEFIALINRVTQYRATAPLSFSDASQGDWYYEDLQKAVHAGFLRGFSDGTVRPDRSLSRQEAAKILALAFGPGSEPPSTPIPFRDASSIGPWASQAVGKLSEMGVLRGYADGTFGPEKDITRAEAVVLLDRMTGQVFEPRTDDKEIYGSLLVNRPGLPLTDRIIDGNLYLTAGIDSGELELQSVTVKGQIYIKGCAPEKILLSGSSAGEIVMDAPGVCPQWILKNSTTAGITVKTAANLTLTGGASVGMLHLSAPCTVSISETSASGTVLLLPGAENSVIYAREGVTVDLRTAPVTVNGSERGPGTMVTGAFPFHWVDVR